MNGMYFPKAALMRTKFWLPVLCLLIFSSCSDKKTVWGTYVSKEGGFSVYMPLNVVKTEKHEVTAFGKQVTHFVTWRPSSFAIDKFKLFQVSYTDCPTHFADSSSLNAKLDSSINLRKNDFTELKDIEATPISLNGYPGRAFIYDESKATTIAIVKQCIANGKRYDLTVIAKRDYPTNAEISAFFNSFQVLK
jgi:hypothetical protein